MHRAVFAGLTADDRGRPHTTGKKRGECGTQKGKGKPCTTALCQERQRSPRSGLPITAATGDYGGYNDDFHPPFPSHCHGHGGDFTWAQKFLLAAPAGQGASERHR